MTKRLLLIVIALCTVSYYAHSAPPVNDLQRYLPPDQLVWLETDNDDRYLALYQQPMVSFARGYMVHLPNWNLHPLQSPLISHLYQQAPLFGWHSWALVPPSRAIRQHQLQQHQSGSVYYQPVDQSFFDQPIEALAQRITQLNEEVVDEPGFSVWVVEGITAAIAVKLLTERPELMPDTLIVIDMYLPQRQLNNEVAEQLSQLQLPVLDIYTANANAWAAKSQPKRQQYSQKHQHVNYRQQALLSSAATAPQELTRAIKGWLKHQGF
ncbi:alpha/beta hydrolase family protein [Idiomarina seosinensis]|uniref:DUF3530 family protein n=1 Tax=Idiomarina seosinensis TaxID=281739 RepID=UPI00384CB23E